MHRIFLVGVLCLAGCQSIVGPFEPKERADDPLLTTNEQQRRARWSHAYADEDLAARSNVVGRPEPSPHGR
jgi:hypothetical protein